MKPSGLERFGRFCAGLLMIAVGIAGMIAQFSTLPFPLRGVHVFLVAREVMLAVAVVYAGISVWSGERI